MRVALKNEGLKGNPQDNHLFVGFPDFDADPCPRNPFEKTARLMSKPTTKTVLNRRLKAHFVTHSLRTGPYGRIAETWIASIRHLEGSFPKVLLLTWAQRKIKLGGASSLLEMDLFGPPKMDFGLPSCPFATNWGSHPKTRHPSWSPMSLLGRGWGIPSHSWRERRKKGEKKEEKNEYAGIMLLICGHILCSMAYC